MELIPSNTNIDFVGKMRFCGILSACVLGISILGWVFLGFNLGIDFRGGTQLQIVVPAAAQGIVDEGRMREAFRKVGYPEAEVTRLGDESQHEFLVRLSTSEADAAGSAAASGRALAAETVGPAAAGEETDSSGAPVDDVDGPEEADETAAQVPPASETAAGKTAEVKSAAQPSPLPDGASLQPAGETTEDDPASAGLVGAVQAALTQEFGVPVVFEGIESIGPRVGAEITWSAIEAVAITSLLILFYIWLRFDLQYAPGAVVALFHDVLVVAGVWVWFRLPFDQNIIAAMLVILGYSINDTVVIYDRIRENVALRGKTLIRQVVNESLNQTLSRTLLTTSFTLVVVIGLLIFGGPVLRGLSLALLVGMISGVYSTVYVASAILIWLEERRAKTAAA
jgi:preprotein translocase subunit SecF